MQLIVTYMYISLLRNANYANFRREKKTLLNYQIISKISKKTVIKRLVYEN